MKRLGSWQRGLNITSVYTYLSAIKSTVTLPNNKKNAFVRDDTNHATCIEGRAQRDGFRGVY